LLPIPSVPRADEGIGPYDKTPHVAIVGGDAHIAPLGTTINQSGNTGTPMPVDITVKTLPPSALKGAKT